MNTDHPPPGSLRHRPRVTVRGRAVTSATAGLVAGVALGWLVSWRVGVLAGWDVLALGFVVATLRVGYGADAAGTEWLAQQEHRGRREVDVLLLAGAVLSLGGIGIALTAGTGAVKTTAVLLAMLTAGLSWGLVNTVYALKYARLFYAGHGGDRHALQFVEDGVRPAFPDFVYFAFSVGMTYGSTDTRPGSPAFRQEVLRNALLAYLFGTGVLAAAIGLVGDLAS